MKLNRFGIAVMTLATLLLATSISSAQNTNATRRAGRRMATVEQRMERLKTELKLDETQQAKVKALFEKEAKERKELMADTALPREERRTKMRALMQDQRKGMKSILSAEQFEKWQQLRERTRERRGNGARSGGNAAPAPAPEPKNQESKAQ